MCSEKLRINNFLARAGIASRRGVEKLIEEGRVSLNGEIVHSFGVKVNPLKDNIEVDGDRVKLPKRFSYFAFYKPKEVVSTMDDPEGRLCIKKFLPKNVRALFPVGRLDYHSEGLMILTNDGDLGLKLLHPKFKVVKTYQVKVKGNPSEISLDRLRRGIFLDEKKTLPIEIKKILKRETNHTWLEIKMKEGRKNQLREMFFRIEHPVIKLKRVAIGNIKLGKMLPGELREITKEEVDELFNKVGGNDEDKIFRTHQKFNALSTGKTGERSRKRIRTKKFNQTRFK